MVLWLCARHLLGANATGMRSEAEGVGVGMILWLFLRHSLDATATGAMSEARASSLAVAVVWSCHLTNIGFMLVGACVF